MARQLLPSACTHFSGRVRKVKVLPTSGEGSSERSAVLTRFSQLYAQ